MQGHSILRLVSLASAALWSVSAHALGLYLEGSQPDTDFPGADYGQRQLLSSADDCRLLCKNDAKCEASTFVPIAGSSNGHCYPKDRVPPPAWKPGSTSWVKPGAGPTSWALLFGTDLPGGDYRARFDAASYSHCAMECEQASQCKASTYVPFESRVGGHCYLKNSVPPETEEFGMVSWLKSPGEESDAGPRIISVKPLSTPATVAIGTPPELAIAVEFFLPDEYANVGALLNVSLIHKGWAVGFGGGPTKITSTGKGSTIITLQSISPQLNGPWVVDSIEAHLFQKAIAFQMPNGKWKLMSETLARRQFPFDYRWWPTVVGTSVPAQVASHPSREPPWIPLLGSSPDLTDNLWLGTTGAAIQVSGVTNVVPCELGDFRGKCATAPANPLPQDFSTAADLGLNGLRSVWVGPPVEDDVCEFAGYFSNEEGRFKTYVSRFGKAMKTACSEMTRSLGKCAYLAPDTDRDHADAADLLYLAGHGSPSGITIAKNERCTLDQMAFGSCSREVGGDDLEYVVFHSCKVLDTSTGFHENWIHTASTIGKHRPFSGLHAAMGFRTNHYNLAGSGGHIANAFAGNLKAGMRVRRAWYEAVDDNRWRVGFYRTKPAVFYLAPYRNEVFADHESEDVCFGHPDYRLGAYYMK